jgi:hypothetical protein
MRRSSCRRRAPAPDSGPLSIESCDGLRVAEQSCLFSSVRFIGKRNVIGKIALTLGLLDLNGLMYWMLRKS